MEGRSGELEGRWGELAIAFCLWNEGLQEELLLAGVWPVGWREETGWVHSIVGRAEIFIVVDVS